MANPIEDSAAATDKILKEKICPYISSKYDEKIKKFKFTLNSINSIQTKETKILRLLKTRPNILKRNKKILTSNCNKNIKIKKQD